MTEDLCIIGAVVAAHGVQGTVRLRSYSDVPGRFGRLETVLLGIEPGQTREYQVLSVSEDGDRVLLRVEGCDDRDTAETLIGCNAYIPESAMERPPEGHHFVHELIGCTMHTASGEYRGIVRDVMLLPANDIYVVDVEGREVLVPAVPAFIKSVDIEARSIVVDPIPGLFEDTDED